VSNVAAFARAGVANGQIEPYEYTDINQTVAGGLSLKGKLWGRPDDTFSLFGMPTRRIIATAAPCQSSECAYTHSFRDAQVARAIELSKPQTALHSGSPVAG
jgi:hypothetical protein